MIFAAGHGTRMRSTLPKVLHPVAGRPMLQLICDTARAAGFTDIVVVTPDQDGPVAEAALQSGEPPVRIAIQEQASGTADAALAARPLIQRPNLLMLNSDQPLFVARTLRAIAERHQASTHALTFLTAHLADPTGFGRVVRRNGRIEGVVEDIEGDSAEVGAPEVNAGAYAMDAEWLWLALDRIEPGAVSGERYLTAVIEHAVADGGAQAHQVAEASEVQHVSTQTDLAEAERIMRERVRLQLMESGVTILDPLTTYVDVGVSVGADTTLEPGVHLKGTTIVGAGCHIGPNAILRDVTIGDRCVIGGSTLEQSTLADDVTVGPYCHLRAGTTVESDAYLGNYSEVKASRIGAGTKIGHFSYIGDADIGRQVNIGAGTVTVNYDGEDKHPTRVGDGAFIGSDSMLVAPVEVGEGARTAAGSVVTRDVAPGSLVMGVPAREAETRDQAERGS